MLRKSGHGVSPYLLGGAEKEGSIEGKRQNEDGSVMK